LNKKYVKIEDGLNKHLYEFLKNYHFEVDLESVAILDYCTNNNFFKKEQKKTINTDLELIKQLKNFTPEKWLDYLSKYNLNYHDIIENDEELKNLLYKMYEKDFLELNY
jgi:hypothetical protein